MKIKNTPFITICMTVLIFTSTLTIGAASDKIGAGFKPISRSAVEGGKKPYHGNFKTMKYHNEFCDHYDCKTCTKIFKTKKDAEKAGYVPCGKCGG